MLEDLIKVDHDYGAYLIAEFYAYRKGKNKAFEWLERTYNQRDEGLTAALGLQLLRSIGEKPRYTAF